eukprot:13118884-Alexandrium_andersonii.AAC.1
MRRGSIERQVLPERPKSVGPGQVANHGSAITSNDTVARATRQDGQGSAGKNSRGDLGSLRGRA